LLTLWSRTGTQADKWRLASVYIDEKTFEFDIKLAFDGKVGNGQDANIGLDQSIII
jgi:hypothetical protein